MEFTLENLQNVVRDAGYEVLASGPDVRTDLVEARKLVEEGALEIELPAPQFFVTVGVDAGNLLGAFDSVSSLVWAHFTRGLMEIDAGVRDGEGYATITQAPSLIRPQRVERVAISCPKPSGPEPRVLTEGSAGVDPRFGPVEE